MKLNPEQKRDAGMFLSLRELSSLLGFSRDTMCAIAKKPGFPLLAKKIRYQDFLEWHRLSTFRPTPLAALAPSPIQTTEDAEEPITPLRSNARPCVNRVPTRSYGPARRIGAKP